MKVLFLSLIIAGCAGAASAEVAARPADVLAQAILATPVTNAQLSRPSLDLTRARSPSRFADPLPAGIARTSVDHRFEDEGAVGSAGYLCGLQPGEKMYGAAGAAGYDPMGKFLGAKLSVAFR
jgi:hypothetical protein